MSNEQKTFTFKAEDIFEDIPGDSENINMNIPAEIMESQGWKEGDTVRVLWGDQGTIIIESVPKEDNDEKEQETE
jgi:antitoxin component of MazEF toxin-antitoxin module